MMMEDEKNDDDDDVVVAHLSQNSQGFYPAGTVTTWIGGSAYSNIIVDEWTLLSFGC